MGGLIALGVIAVFTTVIVSWWRIFTKAGKPGWASIIPVYNLVVKIEIAKSPLWWIAIIFFVPFANIVFIIMLYVNIVKAFGKSGGHAALLLFFPVFYLPYLAFSDAKYVG